MPRRRSVAIGFHKHSVRKPTRGERTLARLMRNVSGTKSLYGSNSFSSSFELPGSTPKKTIDQIKEWLKDQRLSYEVVVGPKNLTIYYYTPRH
jgi:hypothetical protein